LRDREIAGSHDDQHALTDLLEDGDLAKRTDLINACVRARVRKEDQSSIQKHAYAVSHF
jgi:hypothetical protein